jgi:hypothetical protein
MRWLNDQGHNAQVVQTEFEGEAADTGDAA